jgi:ribonuclease D
VEESHAMAKRAVSQAEVNQTWSRWDIAPRLDSDTHKVMTVLFHWRDQQGRNKNQPAHFILSDGLCLDIARRKPRSLAALAENRRIPQGLLKRLGKEIVGAVEWALDNEVTLPFIPSANEQQRAKALKLWTEARGAELGIAAGLLMSEQLALEVARSGTAAISGWRSEAIGESLEQFLSGQTSIFMTEDGATIR